MKDQKIFNDTLSNIRNDQVGNSLEIYSQELTDDDILPLTHALANNQSLTSLNLCCNNIGAEGARALANNQSLTSLSLQSNNIGAEGARALANNQSITELDLWSNGIGDDGARALANNQSLTSLVLNKNNIGDEGARALANNQSLTSLSLYDNNISAEGARALANNQSITSLNLCCNNIGVEGARALANNQSITELNLVGNNIGDEGVRALANNQSITSLYLVCNNIGAEGARALANNQSLTSLNLSENNIGDEGARALANNLSITELNLSWNNIGAEGARALANNHSITSLELGGNNIGAAAQKTINEMLVRNRENAQNFLKECHAGNLPLLQTMLAEHQLSPYCCMRSYTNENYSDPKETDSQHTALHLAVIEGHHDIARWFVKNHSQLLRMTDKNKKTPLMLAKENGKTQMTAILSGKEPQQSIKPEASVEDSKPKTIPIPPLPPSPESKGEKYTVRYAFSPDKDVDQNSFTQLAVSEGETLTSLEKVGEHAGWLCCQNNKGEQGHVPESFLKKTTSISSPPPPPSSASSSTSGIFSSSPINQVRGSFMSNGGPIQATGSQKGANPLKSLNLETQAHHTVESRLVDAGHQAKIRKSHPSETLGVLENGECLSIAEQHTLLTRSLAQNESEGDDDLDAGELSSEVMAQVANTLENFKESFKAQAANLTNQSSTQPIKNDEAARDLSLEAIRKQIETMGKRVDQLDLQEEVKQLQARQAVLWEAHEMRASVSAKIEQFKSHPIMFTFYRTVQLKLGEFFVGCKGLSSGLLARNANSAQDKVASVINLAGQAVPLPGVGCLSNLMALGIGMATDKQKRSKIQKISELMVSMGEIDALGESVARNLTEIYEEILVESLAAQTDAKALAECAVGYMVKTLNKEVPFLQGDAPLKGFESFLIETVITKDKQGFHMGNCTIKARHGRGWNADSALKKPGIKIARESSAGYDFYTDPKHKNLTRPSKYGYRLGAQEEIQKYQLTKGPRALMAGSQRGHGALGENSAFNRTQDDKIRLLQEQVERLTKRDEIVSSSAFNHDSHSP